MNVLGIFDREKWVDAEIYTLRTLTSELLPPDYR